MTETSLALTAISKGSPPKQAVRAAVRVTVRGQVQGVGFRPFVFRLARAFQLAGIVRNSSAGVIIEAEGLRKDVDQFLQRLVADAPAATRLDALTIQDVPLQGLTSFVIDSSDPLAPLHVRLPRDLATCAECRDELFSKGNRRYRYPFTHCTHCGPRYSIIERMPYDRPATAMRRFAPCSSCRMEYAAPDDRRFHAQANACGTCGPQVGLWGSDGQNLAGPNQVIAAAAQCLRRGQIVGLKGLGGFQLLARAGDESAVRRLRERKHRPSKPFAVMAPSLAVAEELARLSDVERRLLQSLKNPIVLVNREQVTETGRRLLAEEIAPHVGTLGLLLPTTGVHHLLLSELDEPVVATSGNRTDEPIVIDEHEAIRRLAGITDVFLVHDRPITRRVDDSVVREIGGKEVVFRLGRGYAPLPLPALETKSLPPVLATGGHQKSAVALWTGTQALLGPHVGDLDQSESRVAFTETVGDLQALHQCEPQVIVCDLHPEYFTTRWAATQARPVIQVQHHHAHAVSCMVEHDLLDHEVLAVTWDGTGFGTDGVIWGGEILRATRADFRHVASLLPFPLPGGAAAVHAPNRTAFGLLWMTLGGSALLGDHGLLRRLGLLGQQAATLDAMIRKGINTPWTSSVGRLFDGIAALVLGIHQTSYEGEAAVWLEAIANRETTECYALPGLPDMECQNVVGDRSIPRSDWRPMLSAILNDLDCGVEPGIVAARFHNALAQWAASVATACELADVILTGGCFQNRLLTERTLEALAQGSMRVHVHSSIPPGDGGLAVGQLAVATARIGNGLQGVKTCVSVFPV